MIYLLQQIVAIIVLACLFIALLYFAATVIIAALVVGALATLYFSIRFFFIRRKLKEALAEYQNTSYSDAYRKDTTENSAHDMTIIDLEYVEVKPKEDPDNQQKRGE